jgi:hypothetical protein
MVFKDSNCRGDSMRVDIPNGEEAYMDLDAITRAGLGKKNQKGNDTASSAMVPLGYSLYLYPGAGHTGDPEVVEGMPIDWDGVMVC